MKTNTVLSCLAIALIVNVADASGKRARFEPPDGKVLLIVGQNLEETQSYLDAAKTVPGGFMGYTSLQDLQGLNAPAHDGDGTQYAQKFMDEHSNTVFQLGLWIVDACDRIARGEMDDQIDRLGDWIASTHRPVFLRIGYEFDGPHNHYPPQDYVTAYRRIVDRLRKKGVHNVAYVWHSYASTISRPLSDWYPGDDYVDWVAISYFNQPHYQMQPVIHFAQEHAKPLMIAESSPWNVQTRWPNSWNLWFTPYFKLIHNNNVKAVSYISSDWDATELFRNQHWGDTRLQSNPEILRQWLQETSQDRYLKSSPDLFKQLGFQSGSGVGLAN